MKKSRAYIFGVAVIIFLVGSIYLLVSFWPKEFHFSFSGWNRGQSQETVSGEDWARVTRAVDGDTIELENGEKVRYVGINTPESVDPRRKVECFGEEASAFNKNLVEGKKVRLEKDISDRDKYGRLLRFVFLEDATLVNEVLVREGYAYASSYTPDISKKEFFREAEAEAMTNMRGLWRSDTCDGKK